MLLSVSKRARINSFSSLSLKNELVDLCHNAINFFVRAVSELYCNTSIVPPKHLLSIQNVTNIETLKLRNKIIACLEVYDDIQTKNLREILMQTGNSLLWKIKLQLSHPNIMMVVYQLESVVQDTNAVILETCCSGQLLYGMLEESDTIIVPDTTIADQFICCCEQVISNMITLICEGTKHVNYVVNTAVPDLSKTIENQVLIKHVEHRKCSF